MNHYHCTNCDAVFHHDAAGRGSEVLNWDPYTEEHYLICPECGSDQLDPVPNKQERERAEAHAEGVRSAAERARRMQDWPNIDTE